MLAPDIMPAQAASESEASNIDTRLMLMLLFEMVSGEQRGEHLYSRAAG
ncbi:MAG: hypothetical protein AB1452_15800 [Pseudomonadota bacterium]